jgi:hypothetical protein
LRSYEATGKLGVKQLACDKTRKNASDSKKSLNFCTRAPPSVGDVSFPTHLEYLRRLAGPTVSHSPPEAVLNALDSLSKIFSAMNPERRISDDSPKLSLICSWMLGSR